MLFIYMQTLLLFQQEKNEYSKMKMSGKDFKFGILVFIISYTCVLQLFQTLGDFEWLN